MSGWWEDQTIADRWLDTGRLKHDATELLDALKGALDVMEGHIASDCDMCGGEGGWDESTPEPKLLPVKHKADCEYVVAKAAIAKAEGRA